MLSMKWSERRLPDGTRALFAPSALPQFLLRPPATPEQSGSLVLLPPLGTVRLGGTQNGV